MTLKNDWVGGEEVTAESLNDTADAVNANAEAISRIPNLHPIRFSTPIAVLGVSTTDRAYEDRTLIEARMRVSSAPAGSPLTVQVQHWDGYAWNTIATLSIVSGSVLEATATFTQEQVVGNMVRINATEVGSSTAATGVTVDVLVSR